MHPGALYPLLHRPADAWLARARQIRAAQMCMYDMSACGVSAWRTAGDDGHGVRAEDLWGAAHFEVVGLQRERMMSGTTNPSDQEDAG